MARGGLARIIWWVDATSSTLCSVGSDHTRSVRVCLETGQDTSNRTLKAIYSITLLHMHTYLLQLLVSKRNYERQQRQAKRSFNRVLSMVFPSDSAWDVEASSPAWGIGNNAGDGSMSGRRPIIRREWGFVMLSRMSKRYLDTVHIKSSDMAVARCELLGELTPFARCVQAPPGTWLLSYIL